MTEKDKLIYKIRKKEYLLVVRSYNLQRNYDNEHEKIVKLGGIEQSVMINKNYLGGDVIIIKFLIPIDNLKQYNKI